MIDVLPALAVGWRSKGSLTPHARENYRAIRPEEDNRYNANDFEALSDLAGNVEIPDISQIEIFMGINLY
ncbi:MAG: hypothetical protein JO283_20075 [Bradyrhizobium sp.]|nr:hypothetical protein [Bradyrhizobium sp.]